MVVGVVGGLAVLIWVVKHAFGSSASGGSQGSPVPGLPFQESGGAGGGSGGTGGGQLPSTVPESMSQPTSPVSARVAATISRLRSDQSALQVFAFQALAYGLRLTDSTPDGIVGPATTAVINRLQTQDNLPVTNSFSPNMIAAAVDVTGYSGGLLRTLPDPIPDDVMGQVNAFIASQVPDNAPFVVSAQQ